MVTGAFTVGAIGHRYLGDESNALFVRTCCHGLLGGLRQRYGHIRAVSALSDGADSIFAQAALATGIELETIIPFANFERDFDGETSREIFKTLRSNAVNEARVNFDARSGLAYRKSMQWLIFKSKIIIAMWDGRETGSVGGTWESVLLCQQLNKPMVRIDAGNRTMHTVINGEQKLLAGKYSTTARFLQSIGL